MKWNTAVITSVWVALLLSGVSQITAQEFVYTSNFGDDTVSGFSVNSATGTLTKVKGSPFPAGDGPGPLTHSPNGHFLYLTILEQSLGGPCGNDFAQLISYSIEPTSGTLSQVGSVTMPDYCPSDIVVDKSEKFVYAAPAHFGEIT